MTLVRWDPFRDLMNLQQRLVAEDSYGTWAPVVDIFEKGDDLVIRAEVPGLEKDKIDIRVENNTLVLRGERERASDFNEKDAYRLERSFGAFTRSFTLPKTVDGSGIVASYKNGVLDIRLPKTEDAKPRQIEINVA